MNEFKEYGRIYQEGYEDGRRSVCEEVNGLLGKAIVDIGEITSRCAGRQATYDEVNERLRKVAGEIGEITSRDAGKSSGGIELVAVEDENCEIWEVMEITRREVKESPIGYEWFRVRKMLGTEEAYCDGKFVHLNDIGNEGV